MDAFPYEFDKSIDEQPVVGLIVLQTDETLEQDLRRLIPTSVNLLASRIPNATEVTKETLGAMTDHMKVSASLLPRDMDFKCVGYGCTSASSVIGPAKIAELVKSGCSTNDVTNPVSGLIDTCNDLGIKSLAFLSPYIEEVSNTLRSVLADNGIESPIFGSFNEGNDRNVARIDGNSIKSAAIELAKQGDVDAIFLSCTNLKTLDVIPQIEAATGKRVLSSNLVMARHMAKLGGFELNPLH